MDVYKLFLLWYWGNRSVEPRLRPYRQIVPGKDLQTAKERACFSKVANIMKVLESAFVLPAGVPRIGALSVAVAKPLYQAAFEAMAMKAYGKAAVGELPSKVGEKSFMTFYDKLHPPNRKRDAERAARRAAAESSSSDSDDDAPQAAQPQPPTEPVPPGLEDVCHIPDDPCPYPDGCGQIGGLWIVWDPTSCVFRYYCVSCRRRDADSESCRHQYEGDGDVTPKCRCGTTMV